MNKAPIIKDIENDLYVRANPEKAKFTQKYFKTGKGEYGEGDRFIGVTVPLIRQIAKKNKNLSLTECVDLLHSQIHEERLLALLIMVEAFHQSGVKEQKSIVNQYLANTKHINNWDLVDLSAHEIIGAYFSDKSKTTLLELAKSKNIWERRIAIIATFYFIKNGDPKTSLLIATLLLEDNHDLIQKAVGWMLREVGKRCSREVEERFLRKYYKKMPRIMLRYAIERFPDNIRKKYLSGKV